MLILFFKKEVIRTNDCSESRKASDYPHRIEENGNCEYRSVAETYFAACPGAHYDATKAKSLQQSHSIL